jgi:hypothetical protein
VHHRNAPAFAVLFAVAMTPVFGQALSPAVDDGTFQAAGAPPLISEIPDQSIWMNQRLEPIFFTITDADTPSGNSVFYFESSNEDIIRGSAINAGFRVDGLTLSLMPAHNAVGTSIISVVASDGTFTVREEFLLTVKAITNGPSITTIANQVIPEDARVTLPFTVSDPDTPLEQLSVTLVSANPQLFTYEFEGNGSGRSLVLLGQTNVSGATWISVSVSDGLGMAATTFDLTIEAVNDAPNISPIPDVHILSGGTVRMGNLFSISDPDDPLPLSLSFESSASNVVADGAIVASGPRGFENQSLDITPNAASGQTEITVTVSDGRLSTVERFTLTVYERLECEVRNAATLGDKFSAEFISNIPGDLVVEKSSNLFVWDPVSFGFGVRSVRFETPANESGQFFRLRRTR